MEYWIRAFARLARDDQHRRVIEILLRKCEYVEEFQEAETRIREWSNSIVGVMIEIFGEAQNKSILSKDISAETAATYINSGITGLFYQWMLRKDSFDIDKQAPRVITLLFRSLRQC
jgi:hypothetical protein